MAYHLTRFEFEKSIPPFKVIKSTFENFAGLELSIIGNLSLKNVDSRVDSVTKTLVNDYDKVNEYYLEERMIDELPVEEMLNFEPQKTLVVNEDNYIEYLSFYNKSFYEIEFETNENSIDILWMRNQKYFRIALEKTFYTLNDESFEKGKKGSNYIKKRFKKLKKWNDYKWYNRPGK